MNIMQDMPFSQIPDRKETIKYLEDLQERQRETPFMVLKDNYVEQLRATLNYAPRWEGNSSHDNDKSIECSADVPDTITITEEVITVGNPPNSFMATYTKRHSGDFFKQCQEGYKSQAISYEYVFEYSSQSATSQEDADEKLRIAIEEDAESFMQRFNEFGQYNADSLGVCKLKAKRDTVVAFGFDPFNEHTAISLGNSVRLSNTITLDYLKSHLTHHEVVVPEVITDNKDYIFRNAIFGKIMTGHHKDKPFYEMKRELKVREDTGMSLDISTVWGYDFADTFYTVMRQFEPFIQYANEVMYLDKSEATRYILNEDLDYAGHDLPIREWEDLRFLGNYIAINNLGSMVSDISEFSNHDSWLGNFNLKYDSWSPDADGLYHEYVDYFGNPTDFYSSKLFLIDNNSKETVLFNDLSNQIRSYLLPDGTLSGRVQSKSEDLLLNSQDGLGLNVKFIPLEVKFAYQVVHDGYTYNNPAKMSKKRDESKTYSRKAYDMKAMSFVIYACVLEYTYIDETSKEIDLFTLFS